MERNVTQNIENINNRVNNLLVQNQPTEGNSELIDIRTGADGKVYSTAGEAVRGQIGNLKTDLMELESATKWHYDFENNTVSGEAITPADNRLLSTRAYTFKPGDYITVPEGFEFRLIQTDLTVRRDWSSTVTIQMFEHELYINIRKTDNSIIRVSDISEVIDTTINLDKIFDKLVTYDDLEETKNKLDAVKDDIKEIADVIPWRYDFENKSVSLVNETEWVETELPSRLLSPKYKVNVGDYFNISGDYSCRVIVYGDDGSILYVRGWENSFEVLSTPRFVKFNIKNNAKPDSPISSEEVTRYVDTNINLDKIFDAPLQKTDLPKYVEHFNSTTDYIYGYYLGTNGEELAYSSKDWAVTKYYDISNLSSITYSGISHPGNIPTSVFYDANKNILKVFKQQPGINTVDVPSGAKFIRFSLYSPDFLSFKIGTLTTGTIVSKEELLDEGVLKDKFNLNIPLNGTDDMIWSYALSLHPICMSLNRVRNRLYWGYTTRLGYSGIAMYDFDTREVKKTHLKKNDIDDHNPVVIYVDTNGTIICSYSDGHNTGTKMHIRCSEVPESIDHFTGDYAIEVGALTCYSQIFKYKDLYYIFFRYNNTSWGCISGTGKGWNTMKPIIKSNMQYYCKFQKTNTEGLLRMCMYSNPDAADTSIRMGFLDLNTGNIYNSDATTILGKMGGAVLYSNFDVLIPTSENGTQRLFDVAITDFDKPSVLYGTFTMTNNSDCVYKWHNNGVTIEICNAGESLWHPKYQNGIAFISNNQVVVGYGKDGYDNLEIWDLSETPSINKSIYKELKGNIPIRNARPVVDVNKKAIIWHRGYYNPDSFTDFNCDAKIYSIEENKILR